MQDIEEKLLFILNIVNDWLKYAEAKNTGILAFSATAVAAIFGFLGSSFQMLPVWRIGLFTGAGFLTCSSLLAVWSFIPKTEINYKCYGTPVNSDNLYFYGHLCKYQPQMLVEALSRLYYNDEADLVTRSNIDIAAQIITNSGIAMNKYNIFKKATWLVFIGLLSIIILPGLLIIFEGF